MSDEQTQAPVEDTPADLPGLTAEQRVNARWGYPLPRLAGADDGPEGAAPVANADAPPVEETPGNDTDWQKRYSDLQPEYTRASQEAAEYRRLIQAAQQGDPDAISRLGFEIADGETDDTPEYEDPYEKLQGEIAELRQWREEQQQQSQQEQLLQQAEQHIQSEISAIDGLDEQDAAWVVDRALRLPPNEQGLPDIQTAHQEFAAWTQARQERYAEQQRQQRRRKPASIAGGQEGTDAPNWEEMSRSDVDAHLAARLADLNAQS